MLTLFLLILFTGITAKAQVSQEGYFSIKENLIVWTKIYEVEPDLEAMRKNSLLEFTSDLTGLIKKSKPISLTKRPLYEITGSFRIEQKEGRYKVEVLNIRAINSMSLTVSSGMFGFSDNTLDYPIEDFGLDKKLEFTPYFLNQIAKPYNNLFSSFFDPKKENEDW